MISQCMLFFDIGLTGYAEVHGYVLDHFLDYSDQAKREREKRNKKQDKKEGKQNHKITKSQNLMSVGSMIIDYNYTYTKNSKSQRWEFVCSLVFGRYLPMVYVIQVTSDPKLNATTLRRVLLLQSTLRFLNYLSKYNICM